MATAVVPANAEDGGSPTQGWTDGGGGSRPVVETGLRRDADEITFTLPRGFLRTTGILVAMLGAGVLLVMLGDRLAEWRGRSGPPSIVNRVPRATRAPDPRSATPHGPASSWPRSADPPRSDG